MTLPSDYNTSYTLIERLCDLNEKEAWSRLHENYTKFIYSILHKMGVDPNDADDVAQEVYIQLSKNIEKFDREKGKFRSWFGIMISRTALKHFRSVKAKYTTQDKYEKYAAVEEQLESDGIENLIEEEWKEYLCNIALERVSKLHRGKAYEVLVMDLEEKSSQEIAETLSIEVSSVYTLRKRVRKTLYNEVASIRAELEL